MLFHYVQKCREGGKNINVVYYVSGKHQSERKVCVVTEEKLEDTKKNMDEIFAVHVYSIQNCKLTDPAALYSADYSVTVDNLPTLYRYCGIEFNGWEKPDSFTADVKPEAVSLLASKSKKETECASPASIKLETELADDDAKGLVAKTSSVENSEGIKLEGVHTSSRVAPSRAGKNSASSKSASKASGIASMFAKIKKKPDSTVKNGCHDSPSDSSGKETTPCGSSSQEDSSPLGSLKQTSSTLSSSLPEKKAEGASSVVQTSKKSTKLSAKKSVRNGKVKPSKGTSQSHPMRKRIVELSDSGSDTDSDASSHHSESPFPPSPPPPTITIASDDDDECLIPPTPVSQEPKVDLIRGKTKKRKLVDKTFVDSEGYFVTKKEYECVSDSGDEESPLPPKKEPVKSPPKKVAKLTSRSPAKKKQSSIMSFFAKK